MNPRPQRPVRLSLEPLEDRLTPSLTPLLTETFEGISSGAPSGWGQWRSGTVGLFQATSGTGIGPSRGFSSNAGSTDTVRAWVATPYAADVQARAAVFVDSLNPVHVFVRGQGAGSATPSYYAVSVTRGLEVQLLRVVGGRATVLASVKSDAWFSSRWVQLSLTAEGDRLQAHVVRSDTGQYLRADGTWQSTASAVIDRRDSLFTAGGQVGVARPAAVAGRVTVDNFQVLAVRPADPIESAAVGTIPAGWGRWTSTSTGAFQVAAGLGIGGSKALVSDGGSTTTARAWINTVQPANAAVEAAVHTGGLVPGQVYLRGSSLGGATPTYYAASVTRGLQVQLLRVVGGRTTVLRSMSSLSYVSNEWVRVSLRAEGDLLRVQVVRVNTGEYLAADRTWKRTPVYAVELRDSAITSGGYAGVNRSPQYSGRVAIDELRVAALGGTPAPSPSPTPAPSSLPPVPRHYSHIRVAQLAYIGTPMGTFEQNLLRNSVDLVVPNTAYLAQMEAIAPKTPKLIYSNLSNVYENLLTDWLAYADRAGLDREAAFYHVAAAATFTGDSGSSRPVNWFWSVQRGSDAAGWQDLTRDARHNASNVEFGVVGRSVAVGYTDRFREINLTLQRAAGTGWAAALEYVTAVDAAGRPTAWATLPVLSNTTSGLRRSGQIVFDPPANWKAASINGGPRLFHVRFRTTGSGTTPIAATILGRDYVGAAGRTTGIIPAFDYAADRDGDGYLRDSEYAARRPGFNARFEYESRMFYPAYGQMRFATNPSNPGFRAWAVDYSARFLASQPLADGLFMDNSFGRLSFGSGTPRESLATYSQDYGTMLAAVDARIAPRWVLANVAGGGVSVDPLVKAGVSYLDEFALRPLAHNHVQFLDMASLVQRRLGLSAGKGYAILDTLPQGGSPTDARTQIAALAYYYLLADPNQTFLMFNGGFEPSTTWTRHWTQAVTYNVGKPTGSWSQFATGVDPSNRLLTYKVFQRHYENALVLYKPLSYTLGRGTGTLASTTATVHNLNGTYRPLLANGTLGAATTRVTLRNGEGAILIKV